MREVALFEAKNTLSALVAEVEATGEEILITRHGAPAARLAPIEAKRARAERAAIVAGILRSREAWAAAHPEAARPIPWETVKGWIDDER
jgi:prevent-host-death family protein